MEVLIRQIEWEYKPSKEENEVSQGETPRDKASQHKAPQAEASHVKQLQYCLYCKSDP